MFDFLKSKCNYGASTPMYLGELSNVEEIKPEPKPEEEKWIWVEGYKGIDENMKAYGDFQYELGKEYSTDESTNVCKHGFHFCLTIVDVLNYYSWIGPFAISQESNRYFKVKALVKQSDVDKYGTIQEIDGSFGTIHKEKVDKLVAKKIVLMEEITETDSFIEALKRKYGVDINNVDELKEARKLGYKKWREIILRSQLQGKYSELFIEILFDKVNRNNLEQKVKEALAYAEECVSKDVAVYLLMKNL